MQSLPLSWLLTLLSSILVVGYAPAQAAPTVSPQKALFTAFEKGDLMVAISSANWRHGLCLAAAHLPVGQTVSLEINLLAKTEYVFISSGASQRSDIDLFLRDSTGAVVAQDVVDDATPVIEYAPPTSGTYTLQIHLVASATPGEFVALSLLRSGGRVIPEPIYREVANRFFTSAKEVGSAYSGTDWQRRPGQWALFGFALGEGEGATLRRLRPGAGSCLIAASGSEKLKNIDLYLANEAYQVVAKDNGPDAFPLITYDSPVDADFDLRVEVERARTSTLLLVGVFKQ